MVHIPEEKPSFWNNPFFTAHVAYRKLSNLNLFICLLIAVILPPIAVINTSIAGVWLLISITYFIQSWVFFKMWKWGHPAFGEYKLPPNKEKKEDVYGTKISRHEWESIIKERPSRNTN